MLIKVHTQMFIILFSILVKIFEKFYDKNAFWLVAASHMFQVV